MMMNVPAPTTKGLDPTTEHPRAAGKKDAASGLFLDIPVVPQAAEVALTALKYLPTPLLVLSSRKMVLLANEAMARLLGLDSMDGEEGEEGEGGGEEEEGVVEHGEDADHTQSLDRLRGQTLSQIGIDIVEDGHAIWVSWEVNGSVGPWKVVMRVHGLIKVLEILGPACR